jgi:hypothetical protein
MRPVGARLERTGSTWSSICHKLRGVLVCLLTVLLKMMLFILLLHALCPGWVLSLRHDRSCGCLKMIFGTRPHGHRPRLWSFVKFTPSSSTSTTAKRSVRHLRHRSMQELVLDRTPRMVFLHSRRLVLCPFRSSTVSLRLLLRGTRALPPLLVLPPSLHSLRSPSKSCFIDIPCGTLN